MSSFNRIYILDLHGNSKKKETTPDGKKDENVFDIMQGVSINIFVKQNKKSSNHTMLYHADLYGKREQKYKTLRDNTLASLPWQKLETREPEYIFVPLNLEAQKSYKKGFSIQKLFPVSSSGIKTHRDNFVVDMNKEELTARISHFFNSGCSDDEVRNTYKLKDNRDWVMSEARTSNEFVSEKIKRVLYRPFDFRQIYYDSSVIDFDRLNVMQHFLLGENIGITFNRQVEVDRDFYDVYVTSDLFTLHSLSLKESNSIAPLYLYPEGNGQQSLAPPLKRKPNLDSEIVETIAQKLKLPFVTEAVKGQKSFASIEIFDYVYAVLHSPRYRETYKEFLKIDFPHIPYPKNQETFWALVKLGAELRQAHLLESPAIENYITAYPKNGDNAITRKTAKKDWELYDSGNELGRVWINDDQYFDKIPLVVWEFYIGGYQPAQKWLKDRSGRKLSFNDIEHYQKIIVALNETHRIMQEIDKIDFE